AFDVTVRALDQSNNVVDNYTGPVSFTSTASNAVLPAPTTQTTGIGTYSATLNSIGNQTISVLDATNNLFGTSQLIAVGAAANITISSTAKPALFGDNFFITAKVTAANPADGVPTGIVHLSGPPGATGEFALVGGIATIEAGPTNPAGHYQVTASYDGDTTF